MLILGIETSCDETAAAILDGEGNILANEIYSQTLEHQKYGGVVPEIASRAHIVKAQEIIEKALTTAKTSITKIDAIAVTAGPGLIGGVIVGLMVAKGMTAANNIPLICVNHLEGHALTCRLTNNVEYPFLLLLVSGGHCQFLMVEALGKYKILGETLDDAIGEAFDKVAKMLGLGYPGGPIVERLATEGDENKYKFPMPLCREKNCDFSLSGLKTAVLRQIEQNSDKLTEIPPDICASFQKTVSDIIINRTENAIMEAKKINPELNNFVLSGGVAANKYINSKLQALLQENNFQYSAPPLKLCTDNAVMIAYAGLERYKRGLFNDLNFQPKARWSLEDSVA